MNYRHSLRNINNLPPDEVSRMIKIIKDENTRMQTLIEKILQTSLLDKTSIQLNLTKINLNSFLTNLLKDLELFLKDYNATVHTEFDIENPIIMGDEVHLRQVIYNLIDNACKYAKDHPEITIKIKQQNTKYLIVEIADNGIGIKRKI